MNPPRAFSMLTPSLLSRLRTLPHAADTVMSTALRCTPYAPSRRVPSNRHRKAVAPPATLKLKSTQLSIIATANVPEETPRGSYHSRAGAIGSLGAPVAFDEVVPGAGVEPACRNYPARDFKSLVSTSFTTRAVTPQNCARRKLEAGVGIEPPSP